MKKKDLKKVSKLLFNQIEEHKSNLRKKRDQYANAEPMMEKGEELSNWCEFDSEVTDKFKKLFYNVLKYPDNLIIEFGEVPSHPYINVNTDSIKSLKKSTITTQPQNGYNKTKLSEDDQLRIEINKTGFVLNYGYRKVTRYKDENIYIELIGDVKNRVKEINADNFNDIWETISKESGLLRDSNLDDIFNEIKD